MVERLAWNWHLLAGRIARGETEPAWVIRMLRGILAGDPAIVARIRPESWDGLFDDAPPDALKVRGFRYEPAEAAARASGPWWNREPIGVRGPAMELQDGELVPVGR